MHKVLTSQGALRDRVGEDVIDSVARQLRQAQETLIACAPIRDALPAGDLEAAYAVQRANTEYYLGQGRAPVGRKIGLTAKSVQRQLGVDQPDFGVVFADMLAAEAESVDVTTLLQPRIEAEIAFVLERDLTMERPMLTDVMNAVGYAVPAVEILTSRIENWNINILDTIADNASAGLIILGATPRSLGSLDLELAGMIMTDRSGEPVSLGVAAACLGNPLHACVWLARKMVEVGMPLKAGDILMSGALGPFVPVRPGEQYQTRIGGLGTLTTRFSAGVAA